MRAGAGILIESRLDGRIGDPHWSSLIHDPAPLRKATHRHPNVAWLGCRGLEDWHVTDSLWNYLANSEAASHRKTHVCKTEFHCFFSTWTFLRSIIFGSFGVWPKMNQFSDSRLILLVCLVLLPSGHTITTSDILNMTEHGLHPACVPGRYTRPFSYPEHQHI